MTQPYRTDIQVRFNDTDALGHLNNTSYAVYAEQARVAFLRAAGEEGGLILAHIALDFRRQGRFGEPVYVLTAVDKVGNTSVRLRQEIYVGDELAAEVGSVVVFFDYQAQRPRPIPAAMRARLEEMSGALTA
ncbi:MAG TPA: thioesterase family protein [Trueperaceae bacterium]